MKINKGDVFTLWSEELKSNFFGFIYSTIRTEIYVGIFEKKDTRIEESYFTEIMNSTYPVIIERTSLAFFKLKYWEKVAENIHNINHPIYPYYKIETLEGVKIIDFEGNFVRMASKEDEKFYTFFNSFSPIRLENATKALIGLLPMDEDYRKLIFEFIQARSNLI